MNLRELRKMARTLARDSKEHMFTSRMIDELINQGIDRLRQYPVFKTMEYLEDDDDVPSILPEPYHYILSMFASARLMEYDERHYEALDRRNEFETLLSQLLSEIENDRVTGAEDNLTNGEYIDAVKDVYFCRRHHRW